MQQLGNFAALPRQNKLRFFSPFWALIRLEIFTGQRSRSDEICHREKEKVFVVVNFIQPPEQDTKREAFYSSRADSEPTTLLPDAALGSVFLSLSPPPPSTKGLYQERIVHFLLSITFIRIFFQREPAMVFRFKKQNSAVAGPRPLVRSLRFTDYTCSGLWKPVTQHQETSKRGLTPHGTRFGFSFVRSGEYFWWTCTVWLSFEASSTAGSSVVVRCAGMDRANQRSLDCCRSQNKQKMLEKGDKETKLNNLERQSTETQADLSFSVV